MSRSKSRRAAKRRAQEQAAAQQQPAQSRKKQPPATTTTPRAAIERVPLPSIASSAPINNARSSNTTIQDTSNPRGNIELTTLGISGSGGITNTNYASIAEDLMREHEKRKTFEGLTTTKLRGIYALIVNIYTRAGTPEDYERCKSDIQYLKVRMAYEAGRDNAVKTFVNRTNLMALVDEINDHEQFLLYCRYSEALVAYFKYYGGKDS